MESRAVLLRTMLIAASVAVLAPVIMAEPAASEPRCGAKTCTRAMQACMGQHCYTERGRNCYSHCRGEFDRCMQTGEFHGRVCGVRTGLIRK